MTWKLNDKYLVGFLLFNFTINGTNLEVCVLLYTNKYVTIRSCARDNSHHSQGILGYVGEAYSNSCSCISVIRRMGLGCWVILNCIIPETTPSWAVFHYLTWSFHFLNHRSTFAEETEKANRASNRTQFNPSLLKICTTKVTADLSWLNNKKNCEPKIYYLKFIKNCFPILFLFYKLHDTNKSMNLKNYEPPSAKLLK